MDLIFIVDNSPSMVGESEALSLAIPAFIAQLEEAGVDYQIGITTTSVSDSGSPGDGGELVGDPKVILGGDPSTEESFQTRLLCEAVCWKECTYDTEREETGDCIEDASDGFDLDNPDEINVDYLHDVCGVNEWEGHCGSGTEEPIEAALLTMCRAVREPPEFCYDTVSNFESGDESTNEGILRKDATPLIVILTDEGDSSRRLATGETDPHEYLLLFNQLNTDYRFMVIGPPYDASDPQNQDCVAGAQPWGIARLYEFTDATDGLYEWLWEKDREDDGTCAYTPTDFAEHLEALAELIATR